MAVALLCLLLGSFVGASLGALGAGGSILTVPALVLLVGLTPHEASTTSLIVVGITAAAAAVGHLRRGAVDLPAALRFAAAGVVGSLAGSFVSAGTSERVLTISFAGIMVVAAVFMWRSARRDRPVRAQSARSRHAVRRTMIAGTGVGLLTGFFGIGGGFLAVPALIYALDLSITTAVGTSLVVIAINAAIALVPRLVGGTIETTVTICFVIGGLIGGLVGTRVAHRVDANRLKRAFSFVVLVAATALVAQAMFG